MLCAECGLPVDPRTGHCSTCGVWSLDDTSMPQASHAGSRGSMPGAQWGTPQAAPQQPPAQPGYATPPPGYEVPTSYANAAPPTAPAPAASSTYWPPPRASERADLPAPPVEVFPQEPYIIPPPGSAKAASPQATTPPQAATPPPAPAAAPSYSAPATPAYSAPPPAAPFSSSPPPAGPVYSAPAPDPAPPVFSAPAPEAAPPIYSAPAPFPAAAQPAPAQPAPTQPAPAQPAPTQPAPAQPAPSVFDLPPSFAGRPPLSDPPFTNESPFTAQPGFMNESPFAGRPFPPDQAATAEHTFGSQPFPVTMPPDPFASLTPQDNTSIDDLDATMVVPRRGKTTSWSLSLPGGGVEVVQGSVIVGRAATPLPTRPGARLLSIDDLTRSISKNHAVFTDENGYLFIEDLDSMNGIVVTRPDGHVTDLIPGERLRLDHGSRVELGDVLLTINRN